MFKAALSAFAAFLFVASAHANDAAVARISVKGIDPGPMTEGKEVKFYGENASSFFQMLPGIKIAGTRDEQRKNNSKYRHLSIGSKGYTLDLDCAKVGSDKDGNEYQLPNGTECKITVSKADPEYGDSFEFKPQVCK